MTNQPENPTRDEVYQRFTTLLVSSQSSILGFIRTLVPNITEAEDLLQKTCLTAWQKFDQFEPGTKFSAWACQIAYYEIKNYLRTRARDRHIFSDAVLDSLADEAPREIERLAEERVALTHCLATLEADDRDLLTRSYLQDTQINQVAAQLGRTASSVYKQLNRIRRRLLLCITARIREGGAS